MNAHRWWQRPYLFGVKTMEKASTVETAPMELRVQNPIEAHGVIGDQRTAAPGATDATIDFLCWPNFDSPRIFASIPETHKGGFCGITYHQYDLHVTCGFPACYYYDLWCFGGRPAMVKLHVLHALRNKRAELAGTLIQLEQQLAPQRAYLTHIDATMRLFDPDIQPNEILPKQRRPTVPDSVTVSVFGKARAMFSRLPCSSGGKRVLRSCETGIWTRGRHKAAARQSR